MFEGFKTHRYTLYAGHLPVASAVGPIQPDGTVLNDQGVQRFQIIDNGLYAMSGELVGPIYRVGEEWVIPDGANNCLYSIGLDIDQ
ncbi:hypothetical protein HFV04_016695 [Pseudomonas sp. BIGb0427]|uniref:hypothetical protein n=1 Tax=Pseudomonas sp. BIGb0427 TaxID=2724470 RepID=UPI0018A74A82|nr:hypothetical protein [Pseudomonas sp. BIGb0427]QPG61167.1 hypothetical protein HFV04_016695 [Pseudomonas sp. BIGb0427]